MGQHPVTTFRKLKPAAAPFRLRSVLEEIAADAAGSTEPVDDGAARQARPPVRPESARDPTRGHSISVSVRLMQLAGDSAAGVLLAQLVYWTRRGVDVEAHDGWIFKTAADWEHETGMSWKMQRRARQILLARGLIEERRQTMPARLEFRLHIAVLGPRLAEHCDVRISADTLPAWRRQDAEVGQLLGRSFAFHAALSRVFPLHTAVLCSRLLLGTRWPPMTSIAMATMTTRRVSLSRDAWHAEAGLSRDQWQTARRNLRAAGVLIERQRNFPRRVDLAVDLATLAAVLSAPATGQINKASNAYRQDRAKQAGGFGHRPIPPSQSPDPACTDHPIPPSDIAQSCPQQEVRQLLQPPPHAQVPTVALIPGFGWGGGGGEQYLKAQRQDPPPRQGTGGRSSAQSADDSGPDASAAVPTTAAVGQGTLAWPACFTEQDRERAARHLAGLDRVIQQAVLDEIAWVHESGKSVRSPVALARTLAVRARAGTFEPDGAHRIAAARSRSTAPVRDRPATATPPTEPVRSERSPEVDARIRDLLAGWKR